jgi:hypothetical protein
MHKDLQGLQGLHMASPGNPGFLLKIFETIGKRPFRNVQRKYQDMEII